MASLLIALKIVPMIFVALFPVVNPIGTALVLYGMTGHVDDKTWTSASRRIALNTFLLLSFFFFFGGFILKLFGISIPVVQLSGGMVVAAIGWGLLNQQEYSKRRPTKTARFHRVAADPVVLPLHLSDHGGPRRPRGRDDLQRASGP